VSFYDEVMRELVLALGAALFFAYAFALVRRRSDASRAGSRGSGSADLAQAPLARTVTFMLIGLIVAVWALASIITQ
jgi:drug/metabolite transporter (DMT)-like permease